MKSLLLVVFAVAYLRLISAKITQKEFNAAVQSSGAPAPPDDVYPYFAAATADFSRKELAMFLAQLIHESGGFRYREEIICQTGDQCAGHYEDAVGLPGKKYYGRGFIQLTWGANYKAASQGLGLGDKLLKNPELVASDTKTAVDVSVWYWKDRVRPMLADNKNKFGVTTKAINGALECTGAPNEQAANRYKIYLKVSEALKVQKKALENGCYN